MDGLSPLQLTTALGLNLAAVYIFFNEVYRGPRKNPATLCRQIFSFFPFHFPVSSSLVAQPTGSRARRGGEGGGHLPYARARRWVCSGGGGLLADTGITARYRSLSYPRSFHRSLAAKTHLFPACTQSFRGHRQRGTFEPLGTQVEGLNFPGTTARCRFHFPRSFHRSLAEKTHLYLSVHSPFEGIGGPVHLNPLAHKWKVLASPVSQHVAVFIFRDRSSQPCGEYSLAPRLHTVLSGASAARYI